jgi:hypothetical protein
VSGRAITAAIVKRGPLAATKDMPSPLRRVLLPSGLFLASVVLRTAPATAQQPPATLAAPAAPSPESGGASDADNESAAQAETAAESAATGEVIVVTEEAPVKEGAVVLDGAAARSAPGALGEPLRALALLPGVSTSVAAVGYPVIRGTLPGESRFSFDGIELPMLYHLFLGNQVLHPAFMGSIELRAGGYGAEHGHLLGGLVTIGAPAIGARPHTEVRANIVEVGAFHSRNLSAGTSLAAAARVGTLSLAAKLVDGRAQLHYFDQQTRLTHQLNNGDELTLTSLGALDYVRTPPEGQLGDVTTFRLGFHRLDGRWTRARGAWRVKAGAQSELDILRADDRSTDFDTRKVTIERAGASALGIRPYLALGVAATPTLGFRAGAELRYRKLMPRGEQLFDTEIPYLQPARTTTTAGGWLSAEARFGRWQVSPSLRTDLYSSRLRIAPPASDPMGRVMDLSPRYVTLDPRLNLTARLPRGLLAELSGGLYSAPPQASLFAEGIAIGPLPVTDGVGSSVGMSKARQVQAAVRGPIGADFDGSVALYVRDTRYALDFAMLDKDFAEATRPDCVNRDETYQERRYDRNLETTAKGLEVMLRRDLGQALSGWVSYSLAKFDRRLPIGTQPHDFDQRHTLNAALQYRVGRWTLGTSLHLHTGRAALYPQISICAAEPIREGEPSPGNYVDYRDDPTNLRRLPLTWRADVRIERRFRLAGLRAKATFEMINLLLREEVIGYQVDFNDQVRPASLILPVPMLGLEAEL